MAKKESATKNQSESRVQVGVAQGAETDRDAVGGSEAEGGGFSQRCPYVVGIGASAGGLQPLQEFFGNMPQDSGLAFVIVQHLSPEFKSLMSELLSRRHTSMALHHVEHGMQLEPDSIYLIPPKKNVVSFQDKLHLIDQDLTRGHLPNFPIDIFFHSLAENLNERAIGVILSGTGSDGTRGVRAINEAGGVVLVQDPQTAEFDGMPRSVIATGLADYVLPPDGLARAIYDYATNPQGGLIKAAAKSDLETTLQEITAIVARDQQIDFSHYRPTTLARRIERRRVIAGCNTLQAYMELLAESDKERAALRNDLLINVTGFFRDPEAWAYLEQQIIPQLIAQAAESEELRIWVTACSTGEEAYSVAMLVQEALEVAGRSLVVKIFATDIDETALQKAATGAYLDGVVKDVTEQRVERFFKKTGQSYQVARQLREMMIFAAHNLTRNPPFTRMHLVACRNLLIYMQPQLQQQVLSALHFALQPKGVLFLGGAETLGDLEPEFGALHKKWKIFEKKRDVRLAASGREVSRVRAGYAPWVKAVTPDLALARRLETTATEAFGAFLRGHEAICLLATPNHELLHVFGDTRRFLFVPEGRGHMDVTEMVPKSLAMPLNTALHRARTQMAPVAYSGVKVEEGDQTRYVDLQVTYHAGSEASPEFLMISLKDAGEASSVPAVQFDADSQAAQRIADLEQELQQAKENLQATIEELETTNEEQQATNQELLASNEELQSTNEELQSVNEELYSVNAEYQSKIQELTDLNNDMDNLLQSTHIGTVFLDKDLRIRKFTSAVTNIITLLEHDVGRPLDQISYGIDMAHDDLLAQITGVLETGQHAECDVESRSGASLLMRINPYRDEAGLTEGAVLSFVDITQKKRAADAVNDARLLAEGIVRTLREPLLVLDDQLHVQSVNDSFLKTFQVGPEETGNRLLYELGNRQWDIPGLRRLLEEVLPRDAWVVDFEVTHTFEKIGERTMLLNARRMSGKASKQILLAIEDVTERKLAEAQLKNAAANLQQKNRELAEFVHTVSHDLKSPLVTIGGMLGLLKEELQEERLVAAGELIATAEETVLGMRDMIDDLLKLSRIGTVANDLQPVGLRQVAEELVRRHAPELEDKDTAVSLELSEDQPTVLADRNRLVEVLDNLIVNALKYACDGPEPRIVIGSETVGREVRLFVKDNGPGIAEEHHEKIFGLFHRLDDSKEGTGVGLAIVKRIMEVHGARVWVESAIGEGATFWLAFPAAVGEAATSLQAQGVGGVHDA
jgi:chemotaxis methyl-accepting protein methylase/signal transduction histidine kinase